MKATKPSEVLECAAWKIENYFNSCCPAIFDVSASNKNLQRAHDFFGKCFKPVRGELYWWGYPYPGAHYTNRRTSERRRGERIIALCLAAAILRSQGG